MVITLYSNVELRSDYSIVFDTSENFWGVQEYTPFQRYLATKTYYEVDLPETYFSNSGTLTVDWEVWRQVPQGITYMRIATGAPEMPIKYFFVDSYEYLNGMLHINYSLDVWHTYSERMTIHDGIIGRAKNIPSTVKKALPAAFESNEGLKFVSLQQNTKFYLLAEYSFYRMQTLADDVFEATNRTNYTALISHNDFGLVNPNVTSTKVNAPKSLMADANLLYTHDEAVSAIQRLTAYQNLKPLGSSKTLNSGWLTLTAVNTTQQVWDKLDIYKRDFSPEENWITANEDAESQRYEITQFYLIPQNVFSPSSLFYASPGNPVNMSLTILKEVETGAQESNKVWRFSEYEFLQLLSDTDNVSTTEVTIPANPFIVGYGFKNLLLPLSYNGLPQKFDMITTVSPIGFSIFLSTSTGLVDLTNNLETPIPFSTPSGTERQLAALSRQEAKRQQAIGLAQTAVAATMAAVGGAGAFAATGTQAKKDLANAQLELGAKSGQGTRLSYAAATIQQREALFGSLQHTGMGVMSTIQSVSSVVSQQAKLNSPINATEATNSAPDAFVNAKYGFGYYTITPNNLNMVDYLVSRTGYETFIITNDYHHGQDSAELNGIYEPIMFSNLQVSGNFPNDIAAVLESILLDGTIISYTPTIYNEI